MNREQAKAKLISLGVEEPTEEQISGFLDTVSDETKSAKASLKSLKDKADKSEELQRQLEELQNQGMSDTDKANKALEDAQKEIANLKASSFRSEAKAILKGGEIDDEDIEALLEGMVADTLENTQARANSYVSTINKVRQATIKNHEKKLLDKTPNPDGGKGNDETKTEAEKFVQSVKPSADGKSSADILANYA